MKRSGMAHEESFSNVVSFVFFVLRDAIRFGTTSVYTRY